MPNPVDVVREFCALMEKRDATALRPLLAHDAVYQNVGMPACAGVDAIVENLGAQFSMFPDAYAFEIVNIASDICQQGICTPKDLETAVTLGLGYPLGPLAMGDRWGPTNILEVLFNMQTVYGDPRYRPSPWLRRRGAIGLSLTHVEE